jgi:hypothetical protein
MDWLYALFLPGANIALARVDGDIAKKWQHGKPDITRFQSGSTRIQRRWGIPCPKRFCTTLGLLLPLVLLLGLSVIYAPQLLDRREQRRSPPLFDVRPLGRRFVARHSTGSLVFEGLLDRVRVLHGSHRRRRLLDVELLKRVSLGSNEINSGGMPLAGDCLTFSLTAHSSKVRISSMPSGLHSQHAMDHLVTIHVCLMDDAFEEIPLFLVVRFQQNLDNVPKLRSRAR